MTKNGRKKTQLKMFKKSFIDQKLHFTPSALKREHPALQK
jgi:hypothetical protein